MLDREIDMEDKNKLTKPSTELLILNIRNWGLWDLRHASTLAYTFIG